MNPRPAPRPKTLVSDARAATEACLGGKTRLAARRITQFLDQRLQASGLSLAQFLLMAQIASAADDRLGALAGQTGLDQSTLSRNLRALERAGLVEITRVESDLRRRAVWLTEQGALRLENAIPLWRRAQDDLAGVVAPGLVQGLVEAAANLPEARDR